VAFLQSGLAGEGRDADQAAAHKGAQGEVASGRIAKSGCDGLDGSGAVFLGGFAEGEGFELQSLQSNLPPGSGVVFHQGADFHPPF
jgi:hypothetical protein